jgi:chromosome segregation ATPase
MSDRGHVGYQIDWNGRFAAISDLAGPKFGLPGPMGSVRSDANNLSILRAPSYEVEQWRLHGCPTQKAKLHGIVRHGKPLSPGLYEKLKADESISECVKKSIDMYKRGDKRLSVSKLEKEISANVSSITFNKIRGGMNCMNENEINNEINNLKKDLNSAKQELIKKNIKIALEKESKQHIPSGTLSQSKQAILDQAEKEKLALEERIASLTDEIENCITRIEERAGQTYNALNAADKDFTAFKDKVDAVIDRNELFNMFDTFLDPQTNIQHTKKQDYIRDRLAFFETHLQSQYTNKTKQVASIMERIDELNNNKLEIESQISELRRELNSIMSELNSIMSELKSGGGNKKNAKKKHE